jgi:glycosyltransferase involved in cell wall biosynthesis
VLWTGFLPRAEVSAAFLAADLAVLPYRDGASFRRGSLMAVLAHGLPVVTTHPRRVPAPPGADVPRLEDGVNARLVPPDDPQALADAVAELIADAALRRRLGEGACELARAFTWDRIAAQTRAVYEQLLDA